MSSQTNICLLVTGSPQVQDNLKDIINKQGNELEALRSEFDLLSSDLELRKELNSELEVQIQNLERKLHAAEEEARDAACQLQIALEARKGLDDEVRGRKSKHFNVCHNGILYINTLCSYLVDPAGGREGDINSTTADS